MAELAKMYPPQANTPETSLSGALTAAGTTVNVVDGTMLPDAPNLLTIGADGSTAETVLMTEKSGNVLTVVRGQDGTTARAWSAGDVIGRYFTAADQKAMQDNITALNNGKTEKVTSPTDGNLVAFDGTTGKQKDSGKKPGDFAAASHTHSGYVEKVSSPVSGNLVAFDGTTGKQKDSGKKPGDFAAASHTHSGYVEKVSSPVSGNLVAFDGTTGKQKDSGKKAGRFRRCQPFTQRICAGAYFPECQRCSVRVEQRQHVCSVPVRGDTDADGRDRKPRAGGHVRGSGSRIRHLRARRAVRQRYGQNLRRVETGGGDHAASYFVH